MSVKDLLYIEEFVEEKDGKIYFTMEPYNGKFLDEIYDRSYLEPFCSPRVPDDILCKIEERLNTLPSPDKEIEEVERMLDENESQ